MVSSLFSCPVHVTFPVPSLALTSPPHSQFSHILTRASLVLCPLSHREQPTPHLLILTSFSFFDTVHKQRLAYAAFFAIFFRPRTDNFGYSLLSKSSYAFKFSTVMLSCKSHLKLKYRIFLLFYSLCLSVLSCSSCLWPCQCVCALSLPLNLHFCCLCGQFLYAAVNHSHPFPHPQIEVPRVARMTPALDT
jgi:hypothetical protein